VIGQEAEGTKGGGATTNSAVGARSSTEALRTEDKTHKVQV
jgi:hypothetical protein